MMINSFIIFFYATTVQIQKGNEFSSTYQK